MKWALDTETIKFARHRAQRKELAREKAVLVKDNRLLRDAMPALIAQAGEYFKQGYFTASYEVVQALPADFDFQGTLGWDQGLILAKVAQYSDEDPTPEGNAPTEDVALSSEVVFVEEENVSAEADVSGANVVLAEGGTVAVGGTTVGGASVVNPEDKAGEKQDDV
ncbi:hypothetical protein LWI28_003448 [Acer negundo]|uniref:Uncharacterized protein n=1 Tax=Acer negundo TaxID=4023 RepID=A0AAD5NXB5_ACENE|nr:hypothetical protein LWI28_003448 [Acer negundo]